MTQQNASKQTLYHPAVSHRISPSTERYIDNFVRNLCAREWVEKYHGTVEEFAAYFSALPADELEVCCFTNLILMFV